MKEKRKRIELDAGEAKLSRGVFSKRLAMLRPALGRGAAAGDAAGFLFSDGWAAACNDELCVVVDFGFSTGIVGGVRADHMLKAVDKLPGDDLAFELRKGEVVIRSVRSAFGVPLQGALPFKELAEGFRGIPKKEWSTVPEGLLDALYFCSFYASRDAARHDMMGVSVSGVDVMSTDGYRITWCKGGGLKEKCFVPYGPASMLPGYKLDFLCLRDGWLCLKGDGVLFCSRLLDYTFPEDKVKSFFGGKGKGGGVEVPKELGGVVDRALVLLEDCFLLDKSVTLEVAKGRMVCSMDRKDVGWFREDIAFPDKGAAFKIDVNPMFIKEVLRHASSMELVSDSILRFYSEDRFEHLISLR